MPYNLNHWNNPRASIATVYKDNDFAYVSRGANIALYTLEQFDLKPSEAKKLTILDYGCGTGRASYFLGKMFKQVVGFDPNKYCIAEAHKENDKMDGKPSNVILTSEMNKIIDCDLAVSTNVIEHLNDADAQVMVNILALKNKGRTLLWYNPINNANVLSRFLDKDVWDSRMEDAKKGARIQIDFFDFNSPRR